MNDKPPVVEVEVLPPEPDRPGGGGSHARGAKEDRGAAFHPYAVALMMLIDGLWMLAEWVAAAWILTIPLSFLSVFIPSVLIHRRFRGDSLRLAVAKSIFLGIVAAVPTPVTGTPIGIALLTWAGIREVDSRTRQR